MYLSRHFAVTCLNSVDLHFTILSILLSSKMNRLTSTSLIRCKMSGTRWFIGMARNSGCCMQIYFNPCSFLGLVFVFPQMPWHHSIVHHNLDISCLSAVGHLHRTHEYVALVASMPKQMARILHPRKTGWWIHDL